MCFKRLLFSLIVCLRQTYAPEANELVSEDRWCNKTIALNHPESFISDMGVSKNRGQTSKMDGL